MHVYLVRHAEAVDKGELPHDEDRPLTDRGRHQARRLAAAFRLRGIDLGAVVSSPLVRTRQTASELAENLLFCDLLAPGAMRPRKLSKYLADVNASSLAVVGHMPDLGDYAEWLIGAAEGSLPLEKAAAACIEFDHEPEKAAGRLLWVVTPEWFMPPVKAVPEASA